MIPCPLTPSTRPRVAAGFTLMELLIVIGLIALLTIIALPVFNKVSEAGNNSKCVANLRAIGSGLAAYIGDHDGNLPLCAQLPNERFGNSGPYRQGTFWFDALNPYMGYPGYAPDRNENFPATTATDTEFPFPWQQCPSKKFPQPLERAMVGYGWNHLNFGQDVSRARQVGFAESGFGTNIRQLVDLSRTIIIGDSIDIEFGTGGNVFRNRFIIDHTFDARIPYPERHSGKANYLFLDGHVEAIAPAFFLTPEGAQLFKQKRL